MELDVSRGFDVTGNEPGQIAIADQFGEQPGHAGQHSVTLRLGDRLAQIKEPAFHQPGELLARGLASEDRHESPAAHFGIGHPGIGELPDIGRDPVQLVERESPRSGPRPAGMDQRAVDVEQDRHDLFLTCAHPTKHPVIGMESDSERRVGLGVEILPACTSSSVSPAITSGRYSLSSWDRLLLREIDQRSPGR